MTGQSYYDYVQRAHLRARRDDLERIAARRPSGPGPVDRIHAGRPGTTAWDPNTDTLPYRGTSAGGGYSTVEDLARFAEALLSHKLLGPDATELLITGKVEHSGRSASDTPTASRMHRDADGNGWVGHGGGAPGMNGDLRIYPKSGYVVAVLANLDPPAAQRVAEYLDPRLAHSAIAGT